MAGTALTSQGSAFSLDSSTSVSGGRREDPDITNSGSFSLQPLSAMASPRPGSLTHPVSVDTESCHLSVSALTHQDRSLLYLMGDMDAPTLGCFPQFLELSKEYILPDAFM